MQNEDWGAVPSRSTDFTCPECRGTIREIEDPDVLRFRCRVGHAFSADDLAAAQDAPVETALWVALQTLEERVQMLESLAGDERKRGRARSTSGFEARAREVRGHAEALRGLLGRIERPPEASPPAPRGSAEASSRGARRASG